MSDAEREELRRVIFGAPSRIAWQRRDDAIIADAILAAGYRKVEAAPSDTDEWCRDEACEFRHWRSGSMPTHKRGDSCPHPVQVEVSAEVLTEVIWEAIGNPALRYREAIRAADAVFARLGGGE